MFQITRKDIYICYTLQSVIPPSVTGHLIWQQRSHSLPFYIRTSDWMMTTNRFLYPMSCLRNAPSQVPTPTIKGNISLIPKGNETTGNIKINSVTRLKLKQYQDGGARVTRTSPRRRENLERHLVSGKNLKVFLLLLLINYLITIVINWECTVLNLSSHRKNVRQPHVGVKCCGGEADLS